MISIFFSYNYIMWIVYNHCVQFLLVEILRGGVWLHDFFIKKRFFFFWRCLAVLIGKNNKLVLG